MQVEGTVRELLQQKNEIQIRAGKLSNDTIAKIQQVAVDDGAELTIENPMDKLESFFVKIVSKAREEKQRTSGAEAGTGITGFLAEKPVIRKESVLDKLVNTSVDAKPVAADAETTRATEQPVTPQQPSEADRGLLEQLTHQNLDSGSTEVPQETENTEKTEAQEPAVKNDVLQDLIGKKQGGTTEMTHPEKTEDADDA